MRTVLANPLSSQAATYLAHFGTLGQCRVFDRREHDAQVLGRWSGNGAASAKRFDAITALRGTPKKRMGKGRVYSGSIANSGICIRADGESACPKLCRDTDQPPFNPGMEYGGSC